MNLYRAYLRRKRFKETFPKSKGKNVLK